jgi:hypothetical protein
MRKLAMLLGPALRELGIHRQAREAQLAALWPALVGPRLARECRPERLLRGTLVVRTSSAALSHQLRIERTILIERLNAQLGDQVVREIRFMVGGQPC